MSADKFIALIGAAAREIKDDYEAARKHARNKDSQRAGHEGEAAWVNLISKWLPLGQIVTRKYIVGPSGETNEIDLVILRPDYPSALTDQPTVLISGVLAAFSCKLTLRKKDILDALEQKRMINSVAGTFGSAWPEVMTGPVPFGLLSQSTGLMPSSQDPRGDFRTLYDDLVHSVDGYAVGHPSEELDALLIADRGFWSTSFSALAPKLQPDGTYKHLPMTAFLEHAPGKELGGYPLVQFLTWLSARCSSGVSSLSALRPVYGLDQQSGTMIFWEGSIYPEHIQANPTVLLNEYGHSKVL